MVGFGEFVHDVLQQRVAFLSREQRAGGRCVVGCRIHRDGGGLAGYFLQRASFPVLQMAALKVDDGLQGDGAKLEIGGGLGPRREEVRAPRGGQVDLLHHVFRGEACAQHRTEVALDNEQHPFAVVVEQLVEVV